MKKGMKKLPEEEDLYIRILKWADSRHSFFYSELLVAMGIKSDSYDDIRLRLQISNGKFLYLEAAALKAWNTAQISRKLSSKGESDSYKLSMSVEDKFHLIEYTELKEARDSSRKATLFAAWALVIAIISLLASIGFSVYELII